MPDEMGSFRVDVEIENPAPPGESRTLTSVLVEPGTVLSWVPAATLESLGIERYKRSRFRQADGTILERWTGAAFLHVAGQRATDDVVFGEAGDLVLLGAHTLEGLNFRIDPVTKQLVDAGPHRQWPRLNAAEPVRAIDRLYRVNRKPHVSPSCAARSLVRSPAAHPSRVRTGANAATCPPSAGRWDLHW